MAANFHKVAIGDIHLALDDKSSLNLGAHGEATQAEREYKKYLVHFTKCVMIITFFSFRLKPIISVSRPSCH